MALYFLKKSPVYSARTSREVHARRQALCRHFNDVYKLGKGSNDEVFAKLVEELAPQGIEYSRAFFSLDKVVLRVTFLWLVEEDQEKKKDILKKNPSAKMAIQCLKDDGILSWSDIKLDEGVNAEAGGQKQEAVETPKFDLSAFQAGQNVIRGYEVMLEGIEDLLAENQELKAMAARVEELERRHADDEAYVRLAEEEIANLNRRLEEVRQLSRYAHSATLQEIADQHPEFVQLSAIIRDMKEFPARRQEQIASLLKRLPQTFAWANDKGGVHYEESFMRALFEFTQEEQEQVIKQLGVLATQGAEHNSLHTRKYEIRLPHSPVGCMVSRGSDVLRFAWQKNGVIKVFWLFRKGDTRVRQSES